MRIDHIIFLKGFFKSSGWITTPLARCPELVTGIDTKVLLMWSLHGFSIQDSVASLMDTESK